LTRPQAGDAGAGSVCTVGRPRAVRRLDEKCPRHDLERPWQAVSKRANLEGVRIHDLRHTHANVGAGAKLGLPIISKLHGHTQASTTARYAHLDADRWAARLIASRTTLLRQWATPTYMPF
jgi:integrase